MPTKPKFDAESLIPPRPTAGAEGSAGQSVGRTPPSAPDDSPPSVTGADPLTVVAGSAPSGVPTSEPDRPDEAEPVLVLDEKTGRWVESTTARPTPIATEVLNDPVAHMRTDRLDPRFAYCFCSVDPNHPSTVEAMRKGYAPYTPPKDTTLRTGQQRRVLSQFGTEPVVVVGDMALFCIPAGHREFYDTAERREAERRMSALDGKVVDKAEEILENSFEQAGIPRRRDDKSRVLTHDQYGRSLTGTTTSYEQFGYEAEEEEPASYSERQRELIESVAREAKRQGVSFGGFNGAFNAGAVPDSRINISGRPAV